EKKGPETGAPTTAPGGRRGAGKGCRAVASSPLYSLLLVGGGRYRAPGSATGIRAACRGHAGDRGSSLICPGRARLHTDVCRDASRCPPSWQWRPAAEKIGCRNPERDHPALPGFARPPARLELAGTVGESIGCLIDECKEIGCAAGRLPAVERDHDGPEHRRGGHAHVQFVDCSLLLADERHELLDAVGLPIEYPRP